MPMPMPILAGEAAADRVTVMGKNIRAARLHWSERGRSSRVSDSSFIVRVLLHGFYEPYV